MLYIDFATFVWQKIDFYHFPLQKFVYVKKKQYLCSAFRTAYTYVRELHKR